MGMWRGYTERVGIRRLVFTVSECDWLPLEWALERIYSFGWWLYSNGFPKWGKRVQHYSALRDLLPLAPICSNDFSASVRREILVTSTHFDQFPPGHPMASLAGTQGRKGRSDVLCRTAEKGNDWRICKSLLLINGSSCLWQEIPGKQP